jgi:glucokinase
VQQLAPVLSRLRLRNPPAHQPPTSDPSMFLGIEIGGTKLQLGVGPGDGSPMVALERLDVDPSRGAEGIREQIARAGSALIQQHGITAIGIGFGGPVDAATGRTIHSHQIDGWDGFPLVDWARKAFGLPVVIGNDSDTAGMAEARFGGGCGKRIVFYFNVGSGIGGAFVLDGKTHPGSTGVASELGHLRPGPQCQRPDQTVESIASGWGIARATRAALEKGEAEAVADLLGRCDGHPDRLTAKMVGQAAIAGNRLAAEIFGRAVQTLGWAVAQMITLVAPEVVVAGGGVPLVGEALFFAPLRAEVDRYVFPPLRGSFAIVPAQLGEEVVVHGALALAKEISCATSS